LGFVQIIPMVLGTQFQVLLTIQVQGKRRWRQLGFVQRILCTKFRIVLLDGNQNNNKERERIEAVEICTETYLLGYSTMSSVPT
jgi:hypothetical protein